MKVKYSYELPVALEFYWRTCDPAKPIQNSTSWESPYCIIPWLSMQWL